MSRKEELEVCIKSAEESIKEFKQKIKDYEKYIRNAENRIVNYKNEYYSGLSKEEYWKGSEDKLKRLKTLNKIKSSSVENCPLGGFGYKCNCWWSKDDKHGFISNPDCKAHGKAARKRLKQMRNIEAIK